MNETGDSNAALLRQIAFTAEKNGWQASNPALINAIQHADEEKEQSVSHVRFHMQGDDERIYI